MSEDTYCIVSSPAWGYGIKVTPAEGTPFVLESGFSSMEKALARLIFLLGRWMSR